MPIFVLQRYLCYEYWAMCYEVYLMCYNRSQSFGNRLDRCGRSIMAVSNKINGYKKKLTLLTFHL